MVAIFEGIDLHGVAVLPSLLSDERVDCMVSDLDRARARGQGYGVRNLPHPPRGLEWHHLLRRFSEPEAPESAHRTPRR